MADREIPQIREHPYQEIPKASATHGALRPTLVKVPEYSTLVVPFRWMLRQNQDAIDERLPVPLPPDDDSPFPSPWVFSAHRQEALSRLFFDQITADESMIFFYTKSGHPLGDYINRLVVGVGFVEGVGPMLRYDSAGGSSYPMWDRVVRHSIRPDGATASSFRTTTTWSPRATTRRTSAVRRCCPRSRSSRSRRMSPRSRMRGSTPGADVALSTLVRSLEAVRAIKRHGVVAGPWDQREDWLNERIARVWQQRGAFPGAGGMLEALGCRLGTSLVMELLASGGVGMLEDPWPLLDAMLRGQTQPPAPYAADVAAVANTYAALSDERRRLLRLLSRFALTTEQARRWWNPKERARAVRRPVTDREILENPYRVAECDLGDASDWPVPIGVIDRGLLPDPTVAAACPVEEPAAVGSPNDARRVRAAARHRAPARRRQWRRAARRNRGARPRRRARPGTTGRDRSRLACRQRPPPWSRKSPASTCWSIAERDVETTCLQLTTSLNARPVCAHLLSKRAAKAVAVAWRGLGGAPPGGPSQTTTTPRSDIALRWRRRPPRSRRSPPAGCRCSSAEQAPARRPCSARCLRSRKLATDGILFLAPTGKARVRITKAATGAEAMTVAQFLWRNGRYDGIRQRPLFDGKDQYRKEKTVVIDECSMLTMDDLLAVLLALDLGTCRATDPGRRSEPASPDRCRASLCRSRRPARRCWTG